MIHACFALVLLCGLAGAQQPATDDDAPAARPEVLAVTRLPVLTDQLRARQFSEAELRALLETALGSGVNLADLVGALEVVVEQLDLGHELPDLALRLPGLIGQGFEGDALATSLQAAGRSATGALPVAVGAAPEPRTEPEPSAD